jgi:hypothetical protein
MRMSKCVAAGFVTALVASAAAGQGGRIVAVNDEWILSDERFQNPEWGPSAAAFAQNVADYFTGGHPGRFLVYSGNFGVTGDRLAAKMREVGHEWTVSRVTVGLVDLLQYDAVFLAHARLDDGQPVDQEMLAAYVNAGGNVYVAGGTGSDDDWNALLTPFGLRFDTGGYDGTSAFPVRSGHPLFRGVSVLAPINGSDIRDLWWPRASQTVVLYAPAGSGVVAVRSGPEPRLALLDSWYTSEVEATIFVTDPEGNGRLYGTASDSCESEQGCRREVYAGERSCIDCGWYCAPFPSASAAAYSGMSIGEGYGTSLIFGGDAKTCGHISTNYVLPTGETVVRVDTRARYTGLVTLSVPKRASMTIEYSESDRAGEFSYEISGAFPFSPIRYLGPARVSIPVLPGLLTLSFESVDRSAYYRISNSFEIWLDLLPDCGADFNTDGYIDFFDFDLFVACFEGSAGASALADFNNDGFTDFFDFDDFVTAFERGC